MPVRRKATGKTSPAAAASWPGDVEPAGYGQRVPGPKGSPRGSGESVERTMNVTSAPAGGGGAAPSGGGDGPRGFPQGWGQGERARGGGGGRRGGGGGFSGSGGGGEPQGGQPPTGVVG